MLSAEESEGRDMSVIVLHARTPMATCETDLWNKPLLPPVLQTGVTALPVLQFFP